MRLRAHSGFTLVEIMIVLIILSVILATFGSKIIGAGDKAKRQLSELKIEQLKSDIEQFKLRYNSLPTSLDELINCSEKTGQGCVPISDKDSLTDAWGTNFRYSLGGNGRSYAIKSLGADAKDGGEGVDFDITFNGP